MQGNCDSNPYRISPFTGYRLPMNSSISKPIVIFNPYAYTMRITEVCFLNEKFHGDDKNTFKGRCLNKYKKKILYLK